jgi:hypothetical protein
MAANEPEHLLEAHLFHIRGDGNDFVAGAELAEALWVSFDVAEELALAPLTRLHVLPLARMLRDGRVEAPIQVRGFGKLNM